jgi:CheY-like chemotaxis protein
LLGYNVHSVGNGRQALEYLERAHQDVDLVLSDVVMPEQGGIALFHAMRERGHLHPLVLMTGHPMQEELEKLQELGLAAWMLKPPRLKQIAEVVAQTLR